MKYILAIDQGTTGSTVLVIDENLSICGRHTEEFPQIYPQPGGVEHDPLAILKSVKASIVGALKNAGIAADKVEAIGITNQRETTILWDNTGEPIYNAIVWQCRRTTEYCSASASGLERVFKEKKDSSRSLLFGHQDYRLLDHVEGAPQRARRVHSLWYNR